MIDSEQIALYAAIQENQADLAPRLIYSDWLEDNDQANEALTWRGAVEWKGKLPGEDMG